MRLAGETAVRWRAGVTSLQMTIQMLARSLLCVAGVWTASTMALVWYWTGYYCGPAAHRYFGRWLLSWLLGKVLPLYFLTIPYEGARYPIVNLYDFLSQKIYYHSFPDWFWHYVPWALIPTALLLGPATWAFAPRASDEGEHLRGLRIVAPRALNRTLRGDGVELAGVRLTRTLESEHIAVVGKTGSGKSNVIRALLRQIDARGETGVVLDPEGEYLSEFYRAERGDAILNPFDARCPRWTPWLELRKDYFEADAEAQATALFPAPPRHADVGSAGFFRNSSRNLYISLLRVADPQQPDVLPGLINLPRAQLKERLKGTPAEALIDPQAHDQGAGIVATVANAVSPLRYLSDHGQHQWSAREWADTRQGWVFITAEEATRDALLPLLSLWLDSIVHRLLSTDLDRARHERVWIVADELAALNRQQKLESLVTRGRKRGLAAVIGFQAMSQLRAIYGHDEAVTLLSSPSTKVILRTDEPETAEWSSRQIGARDVMRDQIGASTGPRELRDGFSLQPHRTTEPAVAPGEIQKLAALTGYLCVTGHDRAQVKFPYLKPLNHQPAFVPRTNKRDQPDNGSVGAVTSKVTPATVATAARHVTGASEAKPAAPQQPEPTTYAKRV